MDVNDNEAVISNAVAKLQAAVEAGRLSAGSVENGTRWLREPQYEKYVSRIIEMIDGEQFDELDRAFWEVIPFGTGGRRGLMGELGTATINERTIAESAHGLAVYSKRARDTEDGRAVVTCDSRNRSDEFSRLTATTLAANGFKVFFFESNRSTPELSFAVRHLNCDVGVMVSASHNPPSDNGFKAYWSSGIQVLSPHDRGIIECVYQSGEIPEVDFDAAVSEGTIEVVGDEIDRAYIDAVLAMSLSDHRELSAIFTPLHGVGETSVFRVLREAGFEGVEIFEPQREPDGDFPNVPDQLPNPERPEVFAPAIEQAKQTGAGLILASDPDADRLGVVAKGCDGEFVHLTGNRIGALLCDYVLRKRAAKGDLSPEHFVVETLVTTPLIAAIAKSHNVRIVDDLLVGFKFIGQTMDALGPEKFVFGAEESLGYLAGEYCRDKDAAVAALFLSELAAELRSEGKTLLDRLDELYVEHGYYVEGQRSEVCKGSQGREQIDGLMRSFRESPPAELAGIEFTEVRDYATHEVRSLPANEKSDELPAPEGDLMIFEASGAELTIRVAVRPSGTEPKIKFYFFATAGCEEAADLSSLKQKTDEKMSACQDALSDWIACRLAESSNS